MTAPPSVNWIDNNIIKYIVPISVPNEYHVRCKLTNKYSIGTFVYLSGGRPAAKAKRINFGPVVVTATITILVNGLFYPRNLSVFFITRVLYNRCRHVIRLFNRFSMVLLFVRFNKHPRFEMFPSSNKRW